MAISLTCSCGARLEIDDTFAGKTIPCPDCQRPLTTPTAAPAAAEEPPPEVDSHVSGLALTSVIVALVGGFVPAVPLAAIGLGMLALRQIARAPEKIGGVNLARAGIILGGVFTVLNLGALLSSEIFGIDSLLRE